VVNYNIVFIEGWPAAGKTSLWSLLDGYDSFFVDPLHTYVLYSINSIFKYKDQKIALTIREARSALCQTEYYKIEQYSKSKTFPISFDSKTQLDKDYIFDWKLFDHNFINAITSKKINAKEFSNIFIYWYLKSYCNGTYLDKTQTFITMTNYWEYNNSAKLNKLIACKYIIISRSPKEIIYSRSSRRPRPQDGKETHHFAPDFYDLISSGEYEKISHFNDHYKSLSKNKSFISISLNNLVYNKKEILLYLCKFLEIKFSEILMKETRDGEELSKKYFLTKSINDIPAFNLYQNILIFLHKILYKVFKKPLNILSVKSLLIYFGLRFLKKR
jgi:hypothetical protein